MLAILATAFAYSLTVALAVLSIKFRDVGLGLGVTVIGGVIIYLVRSAGESREEAELAAEREADWARNRAAQDALLAARNQAIRDEVQEATDAANAASSAMEGAEGRLAPAVAEASAPPADDVTLSVFAPTSARPGQKSFSITVALHREDQAKLVAQRAKARDADASRRGFDKLEARLREGDILRFVLEGDGGDVETPVREAVWNARAREFGRLEVLFRMSIPDRLGVLKPTVTLYVNGVDVGFVRFRIAIKEGMTRVIPVPQVTTVHIHRLTFISYASEDRERALEYGAVLNGQEIPYFLDIMHLDPGIRWERELYRKIDEADQFVLIWSNNARRSEWVIKEAEYAMAVQERKEKANERMKFTLYALEGPPHPEPPPSLKSLMMDDRHRHMIYAAQHAPRYRDANPRPPLATSPPPESVAQ